jgi:hypothetical protein
VQQIEISVPCPENCGTMSTVAWLDQNPSEAIGLIDWCNCLIDELSNQVQVESTGELVLSYPARTSENDALSPQAAVRFGDFSTCIRRVRCERGQAILTGSSQIAWQTADAEGHESFGNERSPYEIIVDQFCRRALGGLMPVPTIRHAISALTTWQSAVREVDGLH